MRRVAIRRVATRRWRTQLLITAFLSSVVLAACADPALRGTAVDPPKVLPAMQLATAAGQAVSFTGGKPTLVFFGYTKCPDVCPTTLADWSRIRQRLGERADDVQFVFVSVDPERDTLDIAQRYASTFDAAIIGVTPDSATSATLQRALGASSYRENTTSAAGYLVAHSAHTFLVDGSGKLVAFYSFGSGWDVMLHDVETLL